MNAFESLLACAGTWEGPNRVQVDAGHPPEESLSQLTVTPILRNTFIHLDHTWSWKGDPQIGALLIGHNPKTGASTIHWIDTWHNRTSVMALTGAFDNHNTLIAHGHFPVDQGPDWGWRIEIHPTTDHLKINMFCLHPNGHQDGGVQSIFHRRP
jgi:hypothetical protein